MYKDKEKQREAIRKAVQKHRQGITTEGITSEGITGQGITGYPDIIDKLTDPIWRAHLIKVCNAFQHRPQDMEVTWLGDTNLSTVCDWLECTA